MSGTPKGDAGPSLLGTTLGGYRLLREIGAMADDDYRRTFNLGIGMILAVPAAGASTASAVLRKLREPHRTIGSVVEMPRGERRRVIYE